MATLVKIEQRAATIELEPEDCLMLARACAVARDASSGLVNTALGTLGALFDALAMAGCAESYGRMPDDWSLSLVREELTPQGWEGR